MGPPSEKTQLQFLYKIQRLLGEGSFTASYKFALLIALADISVERGDDTGAPLWVSINSLAEKFIQYYWPQSAPYPALTGGIKIIHQNTDRQAEIIRRLVEARDRTEGSLARLKLDRSAYHSLIRKVARVVEKMPLFRLQTLGRDQVEFLYPNRIINGGIELLSGVCFCLRQFHFILRDLCQSAWVRFIHRVRANQGLLGEIKDLADFLFGSERTDLFGFTGALKEYQKGDCFYCRRPLKGGQTIDHFVPWSRYPLDLGHNLVLAHHACNLIKPRSINGG